jgi:hypothetical protein
MWNWVRICIQTSFNHPLLIKANRINTGKLALYCFTPESIELLASFIDQPHEAEMPEEVAATEGFDAEITHHIKSILNDMVITTRLSEAGKDFIPVVMQYIDSIRTQYHVPQACDERLLIEVISRLGAAAWETKNRGTKFYCFTQYYF